MNTVQAKSESKGLLVNFNALMRNAVLLALRGEEMTSSDIGKAVGISEEGIIPVLEAMIKEKTLDKKGDKFFRI
jgi:predicted transcriptional regulator